MDAGDLGELLRALAARERQQLAAAAAAGRRLAPGLLLPRAAVVAQIELAAVALAALAPGRPFLIDVGAIVHLRARVVAHHGDSLMVELAVPRGCEQRQVALAAVVAVPAP